ncbi:MAG: S-adenosylmethionine:tRNA ribosyltransferase-isomerase, partial [Bacteroidota bacterium]
HQFFSLPSLLPADTLLVFNNTKVIPARIHFQKDTGALIEILLLQPITPSTLIPQTMQATTTCTWQCIVGNKKRWKTPLTHKVEIEGVAFVLTAQLIDSDKNVVKFSWNNKTVSFYSVLHQLGEMPLPPYIKRAVDTQDQARYQTVYSKAKGAVAAPTAGLHFTEKVLQDLEAQQVSLEFLTLHVGAGTFQPVKEIDNVAKHAMHSEQMLITQANIKHLLRYAKKNLFAVGTTSVRSLESLYWLGVKLLRGEAYTSPFYIEKLYPYQISIAEQPSREEALQAVEQYMEQQQVTTLVGATEIFIFPSYTFKMCEGLITNFHLPATTLVLLVAAFVGEDWRKIYEQALANDYRFLSYGDSSLLVP